MTKSLTNKTILALTLVGAFLFFVSLHLLRRSPELEKDELSFRQAVAKIDKGEVMQGVLGLKEILKTNANHKESIWELGKLSLESGQFDKAEERFRKYLELAKEEREIVGGRILLSDAIRMQGRSNEAVTELILAKKLTSDKELIGTIDKRINSLKK